jgi:putative ABC transport system permease protein
MRYFGLLLRLYPRAYRRHYGREMEAFFRREWEATGGGSGFWLRLTLDHLEAAWAVRSRARRQRGGAATMTTWTDDLRSAARSLARTPAFTAFAATTLAMGVGATTAVFTVVERVALRPLPYPDSERLVLVGIEPRHDPGSVGPLSPALLVGMQDAPGPAEAIAAARTERAVLRGEGDPERVRVTEVSRDLLELLGARPHLGRLLLASDHDGGAEPVVVLGHRTWTERFGADPEIVGKAVSLDDRLHTVVGVLAAGLLPPPEIVEEDDFWVPLSVDPQLRGTFLLTGVLRLRPGATLAEMDAHADAVVAEVYGESDRPNFLLGASLRGYREAVVGPVGGHLAKVLAAVSLLLLIACVNVAGLLLTRGSQRRHELGVHFALGAPRARLVRRLVFESLILAGLGGLLGGGLAWGAVELFRIHAPAGLPRLAEVALDVRGLSFAVTVALATALAFGLGPALRSTVTVTGGVGTPRGLTPGRRDGRLRSALVVVETALAVVLAVGSALLAHDLLRVTREDPGFRPRGLAAMTLNLEPRYQREEWTETWGRIAESASGLPGVLSVAVASQAPWDGSRVASTFRPEGWEGVEAVFATTVAVGGDYVEALGTRVVAGREFTANDGVGEPVAMINEAFARRFWPGQSGVGKLLHADEEGGPVTRVVGVLADVRTRPGRDVAPHVFRPLRQAPWREMEVLVRTSGDAATPAPGLRQIVRRLDPGLPVTSIRTMEALSSRALATPRFYTTLFGSFAAVALLLAVVGVYGTTAFATRARLKEAGIRLALGARAHQVVTALVTRSAFAVLLGVGLGLGGAAAGSAVMADTLAHVGPRDWWTYVLVGLGVIVTGTLAALIPARAAGRADPVTTLRVEWPS